MSPIEERFLVENLCWGQNHFTWPLFYLDFAVWRFGIRSIRLTIHPKEGTVRNEADKRALLGEKIDDLGFAP